MNVRLHEPFFIKLALKMLEIVKMIPHRRLPGVHDDEEGEREVERKFNKQSGP